MPSNEKRTINTHTNEINSDSSERKYIHLTNGLIQSFQIRYTFRVGIQVTVDLFCENITLVHFLVVVCNYVSPFFLYLKECVIISKFESTVSCGLTRETRLTRHKLIAWHTCLLDCMKCSALEGDPSTLWSYSREIEALHGRIVVCLSQEQPGYLTKYIIHWNRDLKTS